MLRTSLVFLVCSLIVSCAHAPIGKDIEPRALIGMACEPGSQIGGVTGTVYMKAKSKEASGSFPAMVKATAPSTLLLEVTNLFGGTEAIISVRDQKYSIKVPEKKNAKQQTMQGDRSWGGIPLHWATELFLGKIPCPSHAALQDAVFSFNSEGAFVVETRASLGREAEQFVYRFRKWAGRPWPESLHWERRGTIITSVDFKFDDPDDLSHSPKKWEAKSPMGEVNVRWRDRQFTKTHSSGS